MISFLKWLRAFMFKAILLGGLALVVTTILSSLIFNLDATIIFGWFCTIILLFFVIVLLIALTCFLIWFTPNNVMILVAAIFAVMVTVAVFITNNEPIVDLQKAATPELLTKLGGVLTDCANKFSSIFAK